MYKYISDLHFGHPEIIKKCNRPFASIKEMNEALVKNINENTDSHDILMILGDVSCYNYNPRKELEAIHCRKVLIIGNHDRALLSHRSFRNQFLDIRESELLNDGDSHLFLSHCPHAEWDGYYRHRHHFYGHIHNSASATSVIMNLYPNAVNVSADVLNFIPRTASWLIDERRKTYALPSHQEIQQAMKIISEKCLI